MKKLLVAGLLALSSLSANAQIFGGSNPILCANGDVVTSPCFAWSLNPRTGFYQPALNQIGVAINGVNVGTWTSTGYSSPFGSTATSYFATGGSAPGVTTSGLQIYQSGGAGPVVSFIDSTRTANNRLAEWTFQSGQLVGRFTNDAYGAATNFLTVTGGQAAGITGITSNSGSGSWVHTGNLGVGGTIQVTSSNNPATGTGAEVLYAGGAATFLGYNRTGAAYIQTAIDGDYLSLKAHSTEQARILYTAGATNYITITGSNGGNPTLTTTGGSLAVTPAIVAASSITATDFFATSTYIAARKIITALSASDVDVALGTALCIYLRDTTNGGTALVIYENATTPVIVSSVAGATTFVTGAPAAGQIQVKNRTGNVGISILANANRNNASVSATILQTQP